MSKNFKVWCLTRDELNAVLEQAERDGYTWTSGQNPTYTLTYTIKVPVGILFISNRLLFTNNLSYFYAYMADDMDKIESCDYIKNGRPAEATAVETVVLNKGELLEVVHRMIDTDDMFRELLTDAPAIVAYTGVLIGKIEEKLFDK